jgi:RNA recognition motif-containing protein
MSAPTPTPTRRSNIQADIQFALAAAQKFRTGRNIKKNRKNPVTPELERSILVAQQAEAVKRKELKESKKSNKKLKLNSTKAKIAAANGNDNDNDGDDDSDNEDIDKDDYAQDMVEVDYQGNRLVTLTPQLIRDALVVDKDEEAYERQEQIEMEKKYSRSSKVSKQTREAQEKSIDSQERLERTIFLSNVLVTATQGEIKTFLGQDISVESIRFRAVGFSTPSGPRWVSFVKKRFNDKRDTCCVFVVLKEKSDVEKVLQLNQKVLLDKHIRVDLASNDGKIDHLRSVFVGNLPYDVTEETLYDIFSTNGTIESIRVVRDNKLGIGRGVAFVQFDDKIAMLQALKLDGRKITQIKDREIRVSRVSPNAFDKTDSFKVQLMKQRTIVEKRKQLSKKTRSQKMKDSVLGKDDSTPASNKRIKIQGSFQKTFGNIGSAGANKKARHVSRDRTSSAPSWQGTRAKPSDNLGRNKPARKAHPNPKKGKK